MCKCGIFNSNFQQLLSVERKYMMNLWIDQIFSFVYIIDNHNKNACLSRFMNMLLLFSC